MTPKPPNPDQVMLTLDELFNGNGRVKIISRESIYAMAVLAWMLRAWRKSGGRVSIDKLMGLSQHGGMSPAQTLAKARRNDLIRALWQSEPEWRELPVAAAARMMRQSADRYERRNWHREQHHPEPPTSEPNATWWRCLHLEDKLPGERTMQRILKK